MEITITLLRAVVTAGASYGAGKLFDKFCTKFNKKISI